MTKYIKFEPKVALDIKKLKKENSQYVIKVQQLIDSIMETPFNGIGKPEQLKGVYSGYWSRRISQKHRIIYTVSSNTIIIYSCYGHYDD